MRPTLLLFMLAALPVYASPECDALLSAPGMTKKERLAEWKHGAAMVCQ